MTDAEKVREALDSFAPFVGPGDNVYELVNDAYPALDSILTELAEAKAVVDEYVAQGPTDREAREMLIEEHNRAEAAEDERDVYRKHYFEWKERAGQAERERDEARAQLAVQRQRGSGLEARIQELEAATRHLFAELDRGYGAAEAFGRLRRVLLARGEA